MRSNYFYSEGAYFLEIEIAAKMNIYVQAFTIFKKLFVFLSDNSKIYSLFLISF